MRPRAARRLGFTGELHAVWIGVGRVIRRHEALGPGIGAARRGLIASADDEAFRYFVQSVHFCQVCHEFVCHECWSASRGTCRLCAGWASTSTAERPLPQTAPSPGVARPVVSVVPDAPRALSGYVPRAALVGAVVLLIVGGGFAMAAVAAGLTSQTVASATATPGQALDATAVPVGTEAPSSSPTTHGTAGPSPDTTVSPNDARTPTRSPATGPKRTSTPTATAAPTHTPTPAPTPTTTPSPTPSPTPTPTVTPLDKPTIACSADPNDGVTPSYKLTCWIATGSYESSDGKNWSLDGGPFGDGQINDLDVHHVQLEVTRVGTDPVTSDVLSGKSGSW